YLTEKLKEENDRPQFSSLPLHFQEIAHLLLECATEDIPKAAEVRTLLKELKEFRQNKARKGLRNLDPYYLQMDNLGLMEINEIRPFFTRAFDELRKLESTEQQTDSQQL
ncbi:hypothetical protein BDK51DRAFT_22418, partial [Blyttiomyces helicus]